MKRWKKWLFGLAAVGVVLIGLATYLGRAAVSTRDSAVAFARDALDRITATWDPDELLALGTPELRRRHKSREALAESLAGTRSKLGSIRAVKLMSWYVNRDYTGKAATTTATLGLLGEFERGPARLELVLQRGDDAQWAIQKITFY